MDKNEFEHWYHNDYQNRKKKVDRRKHNLRKDPEYNKTTHKTKYVIRNSDVICPFLDDGTNTTITCDGLCLDIAEYPVELCCSFDYKRCPQYKYLMNFKY